MWITNPHPATHTNTKGSFYSQFGKKEMQCQTLPMQIWCKQRLVSIALGQTSKALKLCFDAVMWWQGCTTTRECACTVDLQVWHIPALVLEMFSWFEHSVFSPPSLCLSSAGLTQRGLSPAQITQLEMSNQKDQREEEHISLTDHKWQARIRPSAWNKAEHSGKTPDLTAHTHFKA